MRTSGTLGRETTSEVVLVARLRAALERLNPSVPLESIAAAVDQLTADRSAMSQVAANREVYLLLKEGRPDACWAPVRVRVGRGRRV